MEKRPSMDFLNERSITSKRRFNTSPDISMFGPHPKKSFPPALNTEGFDLSCDVDQISSTTSYSEEEVEKSSSSIRSVFNSNRSIIADMPEATSTKSLKKMGEHPTLKQIVMEQKIKLMVRNFVKKLSRNNMNSLPVDYTPFFSEKQLSFLDTQGIQLNDYFSIFHFVCCIFLIIIFSILSTLCTVFKDIESSITFNVISKICLFYFAFEIILNLITVKFQEGKRLGTLRQILQYNIRQTLMADSIIVVILFIDQFIDSSHREMSFLRLLVIWKLGQVFEKIEKLQVFLIRNFYYEQYWSLIKVFLFNFSLAHILAIFLIGMAANGADETWMGYKDIYLAPWYEKYFWAYYWATTIMLTVGFGDLTATNYQEAICLTMIEMISCIALAYNINCVGMLISNIRAQDLEKGKNFKIFYKLSRKNDLPQDLEWRINNYIEQSSNIKKKFNYEEENQFVEKLPQGLKSEFLKESNKKIFKNLPFFRHLTQRTVFTFAQKIEMHICHPEEIIQHLDDPHNLLILKGGEIGLICKKSGCKYNSTVIDQLKILNIAHPILISLGFIKNPRLTYEIKSLAYSVLYFLDHESILNVLKTSQMDYELYCLLKDKSLNMPDDFELFDCDICKDKHTKFTCPKLHFIPIRQHVINRYLYRVRLDTNERISSSRFTCNRFKPLKIVKDNLQTSLQKDKFQSAKSLVCKTNRTKQRALGQGFSDLKEPSLTPLAKQISEIKDYFSKSTAELIKHEMTRAFYHNECYDEVWLIEADKMKNYKYYFENDNSCNLMNKWIDSIFLKERILHSIENHNYQIPDIFYQSSEATSFINLDEAKA